MTFDWMAALVRLTLADPAKGGRAVLALDLPMGARWLALLAAVTVGVVLAYAPLAFSGALAGVPAPLTLVGMQLGVNLLAVAVMTFAGQMAGGRGRFEDALVLVAWLQAMMLLAQVVQFAVMLVLPALSGLMMIAAVGLFFWLLTGFVQALHGFPNRLPVMAGVIATMFGVAMALGVLLLLMGYDPEGLINV